MTDEITREIPWYNDLSEYQQMKLKTFVSWYVREQCLTLLAQSSFDEDFLGMEEFYDELTHEVLEYYFDTLMDTV